MVFLALTGEVVTSNATALITVNYAYLGYHG